MAIYEVLFQQSRFKKSFLLLYDITFPWMKDLQKNQMANWWCSLELYECLGIRMAKVLKEWLKYGCNFLAIVSPQTVMIP